MSLIHPCRRGLIAMAAFSWALVIIGCYPPPPDRGTAGGRRDPYRTTASDRVSDKASMPALYELSDRAAESLVRELTQIDPIRGSSKPLTLELGDLRNMTNTPTLDFELIQHRLRSHLRRSRLFRKYFNIVENIQRMDREATRVTGGDTRTTDRYSADSTYVLLGDFFESRRGNHRRYYFEFKLVNLATRELVWGDEIDLAQQ